MPNNKQNQKSKRKQVKGNKNIHENVNRNNGTGQSSKSGKYKRTRKQKEQQKDKSLYDKDFRNNKKTVTENSRIFMDNANPAAVYEVPITLEALSAPIFAAVCHALQRGWTATVTNPSYPYYAYVYMTQILVNFVTSGTPIAQQTPKWLQVLGQLLTAKTVPMKNGKATYKFTISSQDASNLSWTKQLGPLPYQKYGNLGIPLPTGGEGPNGISTLAQPAAYTVVGGADAYMSFTNYSNQQGDTFNNEMLKTVAATTPTRYMSVVSAYAVNRPIGGGNANCGSPASVIELEVPITDPVCSVFLQRPDNNNTYLSRYGRYNRAWEGDGLTLAGMFMSMKLNQLSFKDPPKYKFIDFNEIVEVLYLWIEGVQNKVANDPAFVENLGQNTGSTLLEDLTCPLTMQEIRIMLRAVLMNLFKDTQYYVQGLYPNVPTSSQDNQFVAFACATGTCAYPGVTEPKFPMVFIENWRLLTMRVNYGQRGGKQNPNIYIPVLGQFFSDTFTSNGASITVTTGTAEDPVQRTVPSFYTQVNEDVISMIDGSTGSGTYKAINDPAYVSSLITLWNEWINRVSSYSTELGTLGTDGGITELTVLPMTKHYQIPSVDSIKSKTDIGILSRVRRIVQAIPQSSPYYNKNVIAYTSQSTFIQHSWETYQQYCIMPINFSSQGSVPTSTFYTRYQAIKEEPHNLILTETDKLYRAFNSHLIFANLAIKDKFTKKSEIDIFLVEAAKRGRGGILSSLGSMLAGAFGVPEPITNAIKMIPL